LDADDEQRSPCSEENSFYLHHLKLAFRFGGTLFLLYGSEMDKFREVKYSRSMKLLIASFPLLSALALCNLAGGERATAPAEQRPPADQQSVPLKQAPDRESLKNELLSIANNMAEASKDGDISYLAQNTTEDFELTDVQGKVQNKNKALADVKVERSIRSWAITNAELASFSETDAVLKYILSITLKTGQSGRARITDTFVQQNGKWMLRSEQQTMIR
jgi:hypothetical protein